ncbi:putative F-box/FBD/LRR-repeat protein At4g13965 [Pyrus x bretschneideri]|uniref:putative F-box/FBD/LRR-repeat protein At4g13965 n=1 Tax=Pyrus x bretschneideri TaxID=225117 RepID=UPI00202EBE7F|nr:putative F-box/FBD/LRR-repeat protein At4g13965 [Pyrus x bretschneideri]
MTKRKRGVVTADRISELPDEVLVSIVSLLSLREAAAMRILSTRWRNIWKSTWTLNFDADPKALERERYVTDPETLKERYVKWVDDLHKLRVVGLSIPLKYLVIRGCDNIESILIRDANLVSFTYDGLKMNLITKNVPLLAEVSIGGYPKVDFLKVAFTQLESCRSQLQILKLLQYKIPYDEDHVFPIFSSLKQLEIAVTDQDYWRLHLLTSFIEASPCLRKLVLHLHHSSFTGQRKIFKRAECSHRYLKVVEMVGYDGSTSDFGLVKYLIKTAVHLEEIGVSHFKSWIYHYTDEKPEESERDRAKKDRAMKELNK